MTGRPAPAPGGFLAVLRRRKLRVLVAAWAIFLLVWAFLGSGVTVREQSEAAAALADLDAAVGDAAGVLAGGPYAYVVGELEHDADCDVTPVRAGEEYQRTLTVFAPSEELGAVEADLLDRLGEHYPLAAAGAGGHVGELPSFVKLELFAGAESVTWTARTGCRPLGPELGQVRPDFRPPAEAAALLSRTSGAEPGEWTLAGVPCGEVAGPGGETRTVRSSAAVGEGGVADLSGIAEELPEGAAVMTATEELLVWRHGDASTMLRLASERAHIAVTVDCGAR